MVEVGGQAGVVTEAMVDAALKRLRGMMGSELMDQCGFYDRDVAREIVEAAVSATEASRQESCLDRSSPQ